MGRAPEVIKSEEKQSLLTSENQDVSVASSSSSSGGSEVPDSEKKVEQPRASVAIEKLTESIGPNKTVGSDVGVCRICLEEDSFIHLATPCGCTGTQKYAHHECIQKWINEKGNLKCEICSQEYQGDFTVPPPRPPPQTFDGVEVLDVPAVEVRLDGFDRGPDFLDESDPYYSRNPAASWCMTFVIFVLFLVALHHTVIVADEMDEEASGNYSNTPSPTDASNSSSVDDTYNTNFSLFLFWVLTKAILIGIPLYTIMKVAARQAGQEHYEAMMRYSSAYDSSVQRVVFRYRMREARDGREAGRDASARETRGIAAAEANV